MTCKAVRYQARVPLIQAVEALKAARAASVQHLIFNDAGPPGSSKDVQPPGSSPLTSILDAVDTLVDER